MAHCQCCGNYTTNRVYCAPCIDEDDLMTSQQEDQYIAQCDGAHERQQVKREQRYLENDANWQ